MPDPDPIIERREITSRAEWLGWRLDDYTAGDAGALFGVHPFRTLLAVWAEKARLTESIADTAILQRGRWGQAAVFAMLADERPNWEIREAKVYLRDAALGMGATPDGSAINPEREGIGCIEAKTVLRSVYESDWPDSEPPLHYQLQTLGNAMLMNASWAAIATLIMDTGGAWYPSIFMMERNAVAEQKIRAAVVRFWTDFDRGFMPTMNIQRDSETITAMYPKALLKHPLDLSADIKLPAELQERARLKTEITKAQTRVLEIDTSIKATLGVHESALVPGWKIAWRNEHVAGYTVEPQERRKLYIAPSKRA